MPKDRIVLVLAVGLLASCNSEQANPTPKKPLPALEGAATANLITVVRLVDELCVRQSASTETMNHALAATRWAWTQVQHSDPKQPLSLDLWSSPPVRLIRGNPAGPDVSVCTIIIEGTAAPKPELLASELAKLANGRGKGEREWWWRSSRGTKSHMDLGESAFDNKTGIGVTVENYRLPWWQALMGS